MTPAAAALALALAAVPACASDESDDVVGPFTGERTRFVVDAFALPLDGTPDVSADLDGDGRRDNQLAVIVAALAGALDDLTTHAPDMIAAGALASSVEIQADDLADDDRAGVFYYGADGAEATVVGGRFRGGAFRSNRTATTRAPGRIALRLPLFADADPLDVPLEGVELELDPDGAGGYDAVVRGGIPFERAAAASYAGVSQMMRGNPAGHRAFARSLDVDRNGELTEAEFLGSSLVNLLLAADIQLFDGGRYAPAPHGTAPDSLSVAFRVHLVPCPSEPRVLPRRLRTGAAGVFAGKPIETEGVTDLVTPSGRCSAAPPAAPCFDRVRDGDETDVDCGGSCGACPAGAACGGAADCQGATCDGGRCSAPSCSDGLANGFETDVDCGGSACAACSAGEACEAGADCASGTCTAGTCAP